MRFGTNVILTRGSQNRDPVFGPGFGREVKAVLIGARGKQVRCRLTEDDPNAGIGPEPAGTIGWWSKSAIKVHKCPHLKTCPGFGKVQCEDKTCPKGGPNAVR